MTNGYFTLAGYQVGTPAGNRTNLGPFNFPASDVTNVQELTLAPGTTTIPVPGGSFGVAIIPPIGAPPAGVTLKSKTVSGDSGDFISTEAPSLLEWDVTNGHVPADLYLVVAGGNITVTVQFL